MILHPDGRVEGTPEEILQWCEIQKIKTNKDLLITLDKKPIAKIKGELTDCPSCKGISMGSGMTIEGYPHKYTMT